MVSMINADLQSCTVWDSITFRPWATVNAWVLFSNNWEKQEALFEYNPGIDQNIEIIANG